MSQIVTTDGNTLSYDQTMTFTTADVYTTPNPSELVLIPYNNRTATNMYISLLSTQVAGFQNAAILPNAVSVVLGGSQTLTLTPTSAPTTSSSSSSYDSGAITIGAIIGISCIALIMIVLPLWVAMNRRKRDNTGRDDGEANGNPSFTAGAAQPPPPPPLYSSRAAF